MTIHDGFTFLVVFALKATVLLTFAMLWLRLLRRSNASARHAVCAATCCALVLLPVLMLTLPAVQIAPAAKIWTSTAAAAASAARSLDSGFADRLPLIVLVIWASGAMWMVLRGVLGWVVLERVRSKSRPLESTVWRNAMKSAMDELGTGSRRAPDLRVGGVDVPLSAGIVHRIVLLPDNAESWNEQKRRTVLLHEVAHATRRDCLWRAIAGVGNASLWFHPFAWILYARLRREEEWACDDAVLSAGVEAASYAEVLLDAAQSLQSRFLVACCMSGQAKNGLRERFVHLLDTSGDHRVGTAAGKWRAPATVLLLASIGFAGTTATEPYRIGGDVSAPKLIHKMEPAYTDAAKKANIQGTVSLSVVIGRGGNVEQVEVTKSLEPGLDEKAMEAVRTWRFAPALRKGKPVAVRAAVEVNFRLL